MMPSFQMLCVFLTAVPYSSHSAVKLKENDPCVTREGKQGICKRLDHCPAGLLTIQVGGRPKTCGFVDDELVICCADEKSNKVVTPSVKALSAKIEYSTAVKKANEKCEEYAKTVILRFENPVLKDGASGIETYDTCARVEEPLVVGGENAKAKEFPHMALIGYGESEVNWLCGGSLISERFVISAAHCSRPSSLGLATWVKLGELDTSSEMDDADPQVFKIIERFVHPQYNRDLLYNDIALFKLEEDVIIYEFIRPLCLFTEDKLPQDQVIATGWGHTSWVQNNTNFKISKLNGTEEDVEQDGVVLDIDLPTLDDISLKKAEEIKFESGTASASLMKVKLNMISTEMCDEKYKPSRGQKLAQGIQGESQLCAGDEAGKDTCQGDSGGPLQIPLKKPYCMYGLVGITSFGKACGTGYPGVYTRISHYLPWIIKTVWSE